MSTDTMREALARISLCSQNSASSKEECGRIARTALAQSEAQPVAWHVCSVNSDGSLSLEHAAAWEEAAHEHINDAINEHDIADASMWVVRPVVTADQLRAAIAAQAEKHAAERDALRAEVEALRAALKPFADADLTLPTVRDTFGFDVLRARAALAQPAEPAALTDEEMRDVMSNAGVRVFQPGLWDVLITAGRAIERAIRSKA